VEVHHWSKRKKKRGTCSQAIEVAAENSKDRNSNQQAGQKGVAARTNGRKDARRLSRGKRQFKLTEKVALRTSHKLSSKGKKENERSKRIQKKGQGRATWIYQLFLSKETCRPAETGKKPPTARRGSSLHASANHGEVRRKSLGGLKGNSGNEKTRPCRWDEPRWALVKNRQSAACRGKSLQKVLHRTRSGGQSTQR